MENIIVPVSTLAGKSKVQCLKTTKSGVWGDLFGPKSVEQPENMYSTV